MPQQLTLEDMIKAANALPASEIKDQAVPSGKAKKISIKSKKETVPQEIKDLVESCSTLPDLAKLGLFILPGTVLPNNNFNSAEDRDVYETLLQENKDYLDTISRQYNAYIPEEIRNTIRNVVSSQGLQWISKVPYNWLWFAPEHYHGIRNRSNLSRNLAFIDKEANVWVIPITFIAEEKKVSYTETGLSYGGRCSRYNGEDYTYRIKSFSFGRWKRATLDPSMILCGNIKPEDVITPYQKEFCEKKNADPFTLLCVPILEQLVKSGFAFADDSHLLNMCNQNKNGITFNRKTDTSAIPDLFNRLISNEKDLGKLKKYFKCSWALCDVLKGESSLEVWDRFRKMEKKGTLKKDDFLSAYTHNFDKNDFECLSSVLNKTDVRTGMHVFTFSSLMNYLDRINMYEAISAREGLPLINDYLRMCSLLGISPKTDSDSLKREHDVTARNYGILARSFERESNNKKLRKAYERNKVFDYQEKEFFARCPRDFEDLFDEAQQQDNCVASYVGSIFAGRSLVFIVRSVHTPQKSLATVELSPDGDIRQRLLSHNRKITNNALLGFTSRLADHVRSINKGAASPMSLDPKYEWVPKEQSEQDVSEHTQQEDEPVL